MISHFVIEPHADDAFLSVGGHMEEWVKAGDDVTIITVFSGTRKRGRDAKDYADAIGANWVGLGFVEGTSLDKTADHKLDTLSFMLDHPRWYLPLGIKHPEHKSVRSTFEQPLGWEVATPSFLYYLDQPYASMPINTEDTRNQLSTTIVRSFLKPNARKYRHIPLFKDQAKFFHFNPAEALKGNIEMIVSY